MEFCVGQMVVNAGGVSSYSFKEACSFIPVEQLPRVAIVACQCLSFVPAFRIPASLACRCISLSISGAVTIEKWNDLSYSMLFIRSLKITSITLGIIGISLGGPPAFLVTSLLLDLVFQIANLKVCLSRDKGPLSVRPLVMGGRNILTDAAFAAISSLSNECARTVIIMLYTFPISFIFHFFGLLLGVGDNIQKGRKWSDLLCEFFQITLSIISCCISFVTEFGYHSEITVPDSGWKVVDFSGRLYQDLHKGHNDVQDLDNYHLFLVSNLGERTELHLEPLGVSMPLAELITTSFDFGEIDAYKENVLQRRFDVVYNLANTAEGPNKKASFVQELVKLVNPPRIAQSKSNLLKVWKVINSMEESEKGLLLKLHLDLVPILCILEQYFEILRESGIDEKIRQEAKKELMDFLHSLALNATESKKLRSSATYVAGRILDYQISLGLIDKDPLVEVATSTILKFHGDKAHPDYVYARTRSIEDEYKTPWAAIEPLSLSLDSSGFALVKLRYQGLQEGLARVQELGKTHREFADWIKKVNQGLKPGSIQLGPEVFKELLESFLTHIDEELVKESSDRLLKLQELVKKIQMEFTDPSRSVKQWMEAPIGTEDSLVDKKQERLYAIAAAILQKEATAPGGGLLSDREELMRSWLPSIQECSVGQEEGIAYCYTNLRSSGEIPSQDSSVAFRLEVENSLAFLDSEVQKVMEEVLPEVLREFGISLNQGVHHSLNLKNILGEGCGLNHTMKRDPFGGIADRVLLSQKRETLLKVFFSLLTKALVVSLKNDTTLEVNAAKSKLYSNLMVFFEDNGIDPKEAWKEIEKPPVLCFLDGRREDVTIETTEECLRGLKEEERLWVLAQGQPLMEQSKLVEFLTLVDLHLVERKKEEFRSDLKDCGKSPQVVDLLVNRKLQEWKKSRPWILQDVEPFYELTDYGVLSFLEKAGYLEVQGKYKEYIDLKTELLLKQRTLGQMDPDALSKAEESMNRLQKEYIAAKRLKAMGALEDTGIIDACEAARGAYEEALALEKLQQAIADLKRSLESYAESNEVPPPKASQIDTLLESALPQDIQELQSAYQFFERKLEDCNLYKLDCEKRLLGTQDEAERASLRQEQVDRAVEIEQIQLQIKTSKQAYEAAYKEYMIDINTFL